MEEIHKQRNTSPGVFFKKVVSHSHFHDSRGKNNLHESQY